MSIVRFAKKLAGTLRALVAYSTFRLPAAGQPVIYLDLVRIPRARTMEQLLIAIRQAGYRVLIQGRISRWMATVMGVLRWHPGARVIWRSPASVRAAMVWTDAATMRLHAAPPCDKTVELRFDYGPDLPPDAGHYVMPFTMHAQLYTQYGALEQLDRYRATRRRLRLLFAGNFNASGYNSPAMNERYGMPTRFQIVNFLLSSGLAEPIRQGSELRGLLAGGYQRRFLIMDATTGRVDQGEWLNTLSQADFFLCPPGLAMPLSHNAIEAMAVGTIPLICYANWFNPPLTPGVNCVAFSSTEGLGQAVRDILALEEPCIQQMRADVIRYYTEHLQLGDFVRRLAAAPEQTLHVHMAAEPPVAPAACAGIRVWLRDRLPI